MAESTVVKNFRDGLVKLTDGTTPTAIEVTIACESGDLSIDGLNEGQAEVTAYLDRGVLCSLRKTNAKFPTFSLSLHLRDLSDATDKIVLDAVRKTGAFSAGKSTSGASADVWTLDLLLTIEGTNYGDAADHTLLLEDCRIEATVAEGDPSSISLSGTCYGAITAT